MNLFYGKIFTTNFLSHSSTKNIPFPSTFFYNVAHKIAAVKIYAYKKPGKCTCRVFNFAIHFIKLKSLFHIFPYIFFLLTIEKNLKWHKESKKFHSLWIYDFRTTLCIFISLLCLVLLIFFKKKTRMEWSHC